MLSEYFITDIQTIIIAYLDINFDYDILELCNKKHHNYILNVWKKFPSYYNLTIKLTETDLYDEIPCNIMINNKLYVHDLEIEEFTIAWNSLTSIIFWNSRIFYKENNYSDSNIYHCKNYFYDLKLNRCNFHFFGHLISPNKIINFIKQNKSYPYHISLLNCESRFTDDVVISSKNNMNDYCITESINDNFCMSFYAILENEVDITLYILNAEYA